MQNNVSKTANEKKQEVVECLVEWSSFMGVESRVKEFGKSVKHDSEGWAIMETEAFFDYEY